MPGEQTKFTTSFIPKKPVTPTVSGYKSSSNFLNIIALAIFLGTIVFGGGVFLYKLGVQKQIEGQIDTLQKARNEFDPNFIKEATRLNNRIIAIRQLLDIHQSPSAVFDLLQEKTLQTIRFNNFRYATDKAKKTVSLDASGVGLRYDSIVLQSDEFGRTGALRDVVFSSVQPNDTGLVTFSLRSQLDPDLVLYRKNLVTGQAPAGEEVSQNNIFR